MTTSDDPTGDPARGDSSQHPRSDDVKGRETGGYGETGGFGDRGYGDRGGFGDQGAGASAERDDAAPDRPEDGG